MEKNSISVSSGDATGGSASENTVSYDVMYTAVYDALIDAQAVTQDVTDGQSIGSIALEYFKGVLGNSVVPQDYVIYVGSPYTYSSGYGGERTAYEYCMAYGDLDVNGTRFSGTGTICTLRTSGDVSVTYEYNQAISLSAPLYYSRSNLGDYSGAIQYDWSGYLTLLFLFLGGVTWFMKKLLRVKY